MHEAHILTSPRLTAAGFRHAFFTRLGGVSGGPFESLSFSASVGDSVENVLQNFERASQSLGVANERICHLNQVHGKSWVQLSEGADRFTTSQLEGDAVLSDCPSIACAVRTADCVPILVADAQSGAVAAIHAGWRGVVGGVVESAISGLLKLIQSAATRPMRRPQLLAAIGPHISLAAFEISEEVALKLEGASSAQSVIDRTSWQKPHADLRKIVRAQLRAAGIEEVDDVLGCTLLEPERFFSFRRSGVESGRHLSAIVPRGHGKGAASPT